MYTPGTTFPNCWRCITRPARSVLSLASGINWIDTGRGVWFGLVRRTYWSKELSGSNRPLVFAKGGLVWDDRNPNDSAESRAEAAIDPPGMRRRPRLRVGCPVCGALSARLISACVHTVDPATSNRTSLWQITIPPSSDLDSTGLSISRQRIEVLEVRIEPQFVIHDACPRSVTCSVKHALSRRKHPSAAQALIPDRSDR